MIPVIFDTIERRLQRYVVKNNGAVAMVLGTIVTPGDWPYASEVAVDIPIGPLEPSDAVAIRNALQASSGQMESREMSPLSGKQQDGISVWNPKSHIHCCMMADVSSGNPPAAAAVFRFDIFQRAAWEVAVFERSVEVRFCPSSTLDKKFKQYRDEKNTAFVDIVRDLWRNAKDVAVSASVPLSVDQTLTTGKPTGKEVGPDVKGKQQLGPDIKGKQQLGPDVKGKHQLGPDVKGKQLTGLEKVGSPDGPATPSKVLQQGGSSSSTGKPNGKPCVMHDGSARKGGQPQGNSISSGVGKVGKPNGKPTGEKGAKREDCPGKGGDVRGKSTGVEGLGDKATGQKGAKPENSPGKGGEAHGKSTGAEGLDCKPTGQKGAKPLDSPSGKGGEAHGKSTGAEGRGDKATGQKGAIPGNNPSGKGGETLGKSTGFVDASIGKGQLTGQKNGKLHEGNSTATGLGGTPKGKGKNGKDDVRKAYFEFMSGKGGAVGSSAFPRKREAPSPPRTADSATFPSAATATSGCGSNEFTNSCNTHYNAKTESMVRAEEDKRRGSLRKFNNLIKGIIIRLTEPHCVLDLGCGHGQDLLKYANLGTARYVGLDSSNKAITEATRRYGTLKRRKILDYEADFYCRDVRDSQAVIFKADTFNLVLCNFALHYIITSEPEALDLLSRVSAVLQTGGLFAVTIMCSDVLEYRLERRGARFGNEEYEVAFAESGRPLTWGTKYDFRFGEDANADGSINHSEFAIPRKQFRDLATANGFEVVVDAGFLDMFARYYKTSGAVKDWYEKCADTKFLQLSANEGDIVSLYRVIMLRKR